MYGLVQEEWIWLGNRNLLYFNSLQPNYTVCPCSSDVALHSCVVVTECNMFHVQGLSQCLAINSSCMCICVPNKLLTFCRFSGTAYGHIGSHRFMLSIAIQLHSLVCMCFISCFCEQWIGFLPFLSLYMQYVDCRDCVGHLLIISCTVGWSSRGWP